MPGLFEKEQLDSYLSLSEAATSQLLQRISEDGWARRGGLGRALFHVVVV